MALCPNCSHEVPIAAAECLGCGASFAGAQAWKPVPHSEEERSAAQFTISKLDASRSLRSWAAWFVYTLVTILTVALAFAEEGWHAPLYGYIAIFICQPWLAIVWVLIALGAPVPNVALSPALVAALSGLNVFLWGSALLLRRRRHA
jgi:hypothetical protein